MILREQQIRRCGECRAPKEVLQEAVFGCDACGKEIGVQEPFKPVPPIYFTIFFKGRDETLDVHCCSWGCVFRALLAMETDYFISLPMLSFESAAPGQGVGDFKDLVRRALREDA